MRRVFVFFLIVNFFWVFSLFSQTSEEREEKILKIKKFEQEILKRKTQAKPFQKIRLYFGYDSDTELTFERKNDTFEGFLYSLDFKKPFPESLFFRLDYDLDFRNYNKITDASTLLNHLKLTLGNKFSFLEAGLGYDFNWLYYTHSAYDFLLHKGFLYLAKEFPKKIYQRLEFYYGLKDYLDRHALGDSLGVYQDKTRRDRRLGTRYSLTWVLSPRLVSHLGFDFYANDSNVRYLDYYDYKIWGPYLFLY